MNMKKLTATAKSLGTFFKVMQKILVITAIVTLCVLISLTIYSAVKEDAIIGSNMNELDVGHLTITLAKEHGLNNKQALSYAWIVSALFPAYAVLGWLDCHYLRKIFAPMAEGKPFHPEVARSMKKLAIVELVFGIVLSAGRTAADAAAVRMFALDQLPKGDVIQSITVNSSLSIPIVSFFVLLLMSWIFSYGAQLQQLSDETL